MTESSFAAGGFEEGPRFSGGRLQGRANVERTGGSHCSGDFGRRGCENGMSVGAERCGDLLRQSSQSCVAKVQIGNARRFKSCGQSVHDDHLLWPLLLLPLLRSSAALRVPVQFCSHVGPRFITWLGPYHGPDAVHSAPHYLSHASVASSQRLRETACVLMSCQP